MWVRSCREVDQVSEVKYDCNRYCIEWKGDGVRVRVRGQTV